MKQLIITMTMAAVTMMACGSGKTADTALSTDSVKFESKGKMVEVSITAEYPKTGNPLLINAIEEYISEELGGTYEGNPACGDSLVAFYGNAVAEKKNKEADEYWSTDREPLQYTHTFDKIYETDRVVTYTSGCYNYTGGAHGIYVFEGITFRKSDGRRFGMEMLRDTGNDDFRLLIKEGLMEYFAAQDSTITTDEALKTCLLTDHVVDFLPLPQYPPYLTEKGVAFVYQAYEIAPYAAGLPSFIIPYEKIRPYLTVTARKLVE